jgi:Flp pilus assembly protein TadD
MRNRVFTAMVVVAACGLAGCAGHGKYTTEGLSKSQERVAGLKSMNEYQQAEQAFNAGDLEKAQKYVDRSIIINPSVAKSHVLKGRVLIEKSDLEGALRSLQQAEALDPRNVDAQYFQGFVYERFAQSANAAERYAKAAELDPNNPQYAVAAAEMMIDSGKVDEAKTMLESRNVSFEHNAGVRQTLGHIAMIKGDMPAARKLFGEAHLLAPDDTVIMEDLIHSQIATSEYAEAQFNISRLIKNDKNKDRRDLKQLQARCLVNLDKPIEARELLIQLTNDPEGQKDAETWIELGNVSYVLKDQSRLRQSSQRVLAIAPARSEGYLLRALWLRRQGDLPGALASLDKALERSTTDADSMMLRGLVLKELGRRDEAREAFAAILQQDPANEPARNAYESLRFATASEELAPGEPK